MSDNTDTTTGGKWRYSLQNLPTLEVTFRKSSWEAVKAFCDEIVSAHKQDAPSAGHGDVIAHLTAPAIHEIHLVFEEELKDVMEWHTAHSHTMSEKLAKFISDHIDLLTNVKDDIEEAGVPFADDADDEDDEDEC